MQDVEEELLDGLLGSVLVVAVEFDGLAAHDNVEHLGVDCLLGGLGHLLARKVNQQVGDREDRIARLIADVDVDDAAIFLGDNSHERER